MFPRKMSLDHQGFYKAIADRYLDSSKEVDRKLYVEDLHLQADGTDPIELLATQIKCDQMFADATGASYLFTGQRGTGKTTELFRLKQKLSQSGLVVYRLDLAEFLNLTSRVEIQDFLIAVIGGFSEAVKGDPQVGEDPSHEGYFARMKNFLQSKVQLDGLSVGLPVVGADIDLAAALKTDVTFKQTLQEKTRSHVSSMVLDARNYVADAVKFIRAKTGNPRAQIVLIVDSFERIRGVGSKAEDVFSSVHDLFSGQSDNLKFPGLQIVYTIPPYLLAMANSLAAYYDGGAVFALSSVHLFHSRSRDVSDQGMTQMITIVSRRYPNWAKFISEELLKRLAQSSGGDIRDYFRMIQLCLMKAMQPKVSPNGVISEALVESTEAMLRRDMLPIPEDDMIWLKKIAERHDACLPSNQYLGTLARFFDGKLVLNYRNGEDWYDVHPLIRRHVGPTVAQS